MEDEALAPGDRLPNHLRQFAMPPNRPIPRFDQPLPILARREEIAAAVRDHPVVILTGETGSGKTTQLPQICLSVGRGAKGLIAHTQPRRLAARAVAARVAEELHVPLGGAVGVKVRFTDQTSDRTIIKMMTDGILLAEIQSDPELRAYDTIIIDEAHERSLNIDFLLGYLKLLLPRRPDLRVIVTSATIEPARFARFFAQEGKDAPIINVSGRLYPVDVRYRPIEIRDAGLRLDPRAVAEAIDEVLRLRVDRAKDDHTRADDVLVFLPGEGEIRQVGDELRRSGVDADVLSLFSRLSNDEQDRIFHPGARRRVVLATNVAETSLTVPRIRYVVDAGLARVRRYDARAKVDRLPVEPISQASANQRSGRCGRVASGVAVRLYSEASFRERPALTDPEIRRTNLASVILHLMTLNLGSVERFPFLDPPDAHAIQDGYETLFELGAIDSKPIRVEAWSTTELAPQDQPSLRVPSPTAHARTPRLTPIGARMTRLPIDPRVARMLIAAGEMGSLAEVLVLAAALSVQDPRERPANAQESADRVQVVFRHDSSDFLSLLRLWEQYHHAARHSGAAGLRDWCRSHFLSHSRMREWIDTHEQLSDIAEELDLSRNHTPAGEDDIHKALLTGLISNVACKDEGHASFDYRGVRGNVVSIFPGSVLFKKAPKWIMAAEIVHTTRLYARMVARIDPAWIEEVAAHMFQRQLSDKHYDAESHQPSAWERVTMNGIVVVPRRRVPLASVDPKAARTIFIREGLVNARFAPDLECTRHNREVLRQARCVESKLRRGGLLRSDEERADWFERRLLPSVCDPASFVALQAPNQGALKLSLADVLTPTALHAANEAQFPDSLLLETDGDLIECPLRYAFEAGKDHDGVTLQLPLTSLYALTPERACWLVPGMLESKIVALLKGLPKGLRATIERSGPLQELARDLAGVMPFAHGPLGAALSEALSILRGFDVPPDAWIMTGVPQHLQLRVVVVDRDGTEIASGRDLQDLQKRLAVRHQRAIASAARERFERQGIREWNFGELPEMVCTDPVNGSSAYPALVDEVASVSLTLLASKEVAAVETDRGVRRLFAIACGEEVAHRLHAHASWSDLGRWYKSIGTTDDLRDALTCLIVERAFLASQGPVRSRDVFEQRQQEQWGRLPQATIEVVDAVAKMLEPRFRVAQRISGGTPRLWANSIADLREHAAYLMPTGFLRVVPWDRLREYPRYAQGMWERLLRLREDGSGTESATLLAFAPHWKRFTGWVARTMALERSEREAAGDHSAPMKGANTTSPLPQARRVAARVNLEAGDWAMQPGVLPGPVSEYRWLLEEYRLALFAPELARGAKPTALSKSLEDLWRRIESAAP